MAGLGTLTVYLNSNSTGLDRGLASATKSLKKFAAMAGTAFAGYQLKQFAQESLNLAAQQEKAEVMLTRQLKNTAGMADFTAGELKRYAAEAQRLTIFGDEAVMQAQTRLLQMNSVTGEAFRMTRDIALDIASATGQDLTSVMQTLGKAMQDPVKGLRQLREFGVDPGMKTEIEKRIAAEGKEAAQLQLLADLQQRYAGAAATAADTIEGAQKRNANAWSDLKEAIGFTLAEIFDVKGILETSGGWFSDWADYLRKNALQIGFAFQSVWIDIKIGAQKLYAYIAPVLNQLGEVVSAVAHNMMEFIQALPKWLAGEDYSMKVLTPVWRMQEEYAKLDEEIERIAKKGIIQHKELEMRYKLKLEKQALDEMAKGAADGTKKGMIEAAKEQQRKTFDVPSAIEGSQDAWRIILNAMKFTLGTRGANAAAAVQSGATQPQNKPTAGGSGSGSASGSGSVSRAGGGGGMPAIQPFRPQIPPQHEDRQIITTEIAPQRGTPQQPKIPGWFQGMIGRGSSATLGSGSGQITTKAPDYGNWLYRLFVSKERQDKFWEIAGSPVVLPKRTQAATDEQKKQVQLAQAQLEVTKRMAKGIEYLWGDPVNL